MAATLMDGNALRDELVAGIRRRIEQAGSPAVCLATVLVGDRPDSAAYVSSKGKACQELGMGSVSERLPADASQEQVEELVKRLNADPKINGILVQLPMPSHIDEERVLSLINIEKDVDGAPSLPPALPPVPACAGSASESSCVSTVARGSAVTGGAAIHPVPRRRS